MSKRVWERLWVRLPLKNRERFSNEYLIYILNHPVFELPSLTSSIAPFLYASVNIGSGIWLRKCRQWYKVSLPYPPPLRCRCSPLFREIMCYQTLPKWVITCYQTLSKYEKNKESLWFFLWKIWASKNYLKTKIWISNVICQVAVIG